MASSGGRRGIRGGSRLPVTAAQMAALRLRARGLTMDETAARLGVSVQTVKNHQSVAYDRLGARNLVEAMVALGWLEVPEA